MSYYVRVAFKPAMNELEAFRLAKEFLSSLRSDVPGVIRENLYFLMQNAPKGSSDFFLLRQLVHRLMEVRFVYWEKENLLGVFGGWCTDEILKANEFSVVSFQNSCDQDYEFDTWPEFPYFQSVIESVKALNAADLPRLKEMIEDEGEDIDLEYAEDYARRTAVYERVFSDLDIDAILYDNDPSPEIFIMNASTSQEKDAKNAILALKLIKEFEAEIN